MPTHPSHDSWPHRELHRRPAAGVACSSTFMSAHPSHGSWSHRKLHRRPQRQGSHAVPLSCRRALRTVRGRIGSATEGSSGR
eukprot:9250130-Pyramimonas_sp.AAC.1